MRKLLWPLLSMLLISIFLVGCDSNGTAAQGKLSLEAFLEDVQDDETAPQEMRDDLIDNTDPIEENSLKEDGRYNDKDSVALYIHSFGKLPSNYITKSEAQKSGWNSKDNYLSDTAPGMSIGGDHFGNYEELLPKKDGRTYKECDIDYESGSRNAKRIVFSNDGLIFYTDDHYKSFEQIY